MKLKKLFIAAFAAAATVLFVACDSPEKAVKEFHQAINDRDAEKLAEVIYFDKDRREEKKNADQSEAEWAHDLIDKVRGNEREVSYRESMEVVACKVNGSKATVVVCYKPDWLDDFPGAVDFKTFTCEKDDGKWKIDRF